MDLSSVKLLVVGAGGIGCELLKNLVLTGFSQIEVIDLDTIELSNLNRQFLFQKVHVGKPKALIARESVLKYNKNAEIVAHHDSIMNVKYNVEYFKQFKMVLNALDNKAARSHVNRLCLAADVPLIESGSAGYLGQITLIKKGVTECYDCLPKPPAKTFPGCTIRNTPSEPIHCIVWAKHLFNQLFGADDPDQAVSPDGEDPENMAEAGKAAVEKSSNEEAVVRVSTRQWAKETNYDSNKIFKKLFNDDIKYLLSMAKLWEKRKPPTPLDYDECVANSSLLDKNSTNSNNDSNRLGSHKMWTISECSELFTNSIKALHSRLDLNNPESILVWDKDDEDAMNFVASAANLRCLIFSISPKTKFEIKSLAGNIIPAIATTNAIIAGLIVLQALKVLKSNLNECKTVYLRDKPLQNKLIVSSELAKPNEKCYVCASKPELRVKLNMNTFTIKQLETKILKQELNMVQPDVEIDDGTGRIIISSEEGETEENNDKTLTHFGITDQCSLKCDDFFQNYQLKITLINCEKLEENNGKEYEIVSENQMLKDLKDKQQNEIKKPEDEAKEAVTSTNEIAKEVLVEEKKRRYETAFADDETSTSLTSNQAKSNKKRRSSFNENEASAAAGETVNKNVNEMEQDDVLCSSDSINDASDAISEEEQVVTEKKKEIVVEDDDIIIEEDSNEEFVNNSKQTNEHKNFGLHSNDSNDHNLNTNSNSNNKHSNENSNDQDDDIIECTSEEDVIEISDELDENSKDDVNQVQNGNDHNNHNHNSDHLHDPIELKKQLHAKQANIENTANNDSSDLNHQEVKIKNGNHKQHNESDDGITVIE